MNIVIIGAQKAGTTWLYKMMRQQPRVGTAFIKEIHYFDNRCKDDFDFAKRRRFLKKKLIPSGRCLNPAYEQYIEYCLNKKLAYTDEWYRNIFLMKPKNRMRIERGESLVFLEASPSYMTMPEHGVAHMANMLKDIVPILIIRDPIRRMISGLTMEMARHDNEVLQQKHVSNWITAMQIPRGSYSTAIPTFRKYFKDVLIIPFSQVSSQPVELLRRIEKLYGLDEIEYEEAGKKVNSKTGIVRLSEESLTQIKRVCEPEYEYLKTEFGPQFLSQI